MATFPRIQGPQQIQTGDQSLVNAVPQFKAGAGAAIGKGLMDLGDVGFKLKEEYEKANDAEILIRAQGRLRDEQVSFAEFQQQTPNEAEWVPELKRRIQAVEADFGKERLTPNARLQLQDSLSQFSTGALIRVQGASFVQAGNRAIGTAQNEARKLAKAGRFEEIPSVFQPVPETSLPSWERDRMVADLQDEGKRQALMDFRKQRDNLLAEDKWDEAYTLTQSAVDRGIADDEDENTMRIAFEQEKAWGSVRQAADRDPVIAKSLLMTGKFKGLTQEQKDKAESYIDNKLRDYRKRELETIANGLATGAIKNSAQLKREWNDEATFAAVKDQIDGAPYSEDQAASERLDLEKLIRTYAKDGDPDRRQMMNISARLKRMPSGTVDDLQPLWDKRRQGEEPKTKDRYMSAALQVVNERFKQRTLPFRDGDTGPVKPKNLMQFNAEAAEAARLRIEIDKAIPEDADMETARKAVEKVLSAPVADQIEGQLFGEDNGWQLLLPSLDNNLPTTTW